MTVDIANACSGNYIIASTYALDWAFENVLHDHDKVLVLTALKPVMPSGGVDFYVGTDTVELEAEVEKQAISDVKKLVTETRAKHQKHVDITIKVIWADPRDALMDAVSCLSHISQHGALTFRWRYGTL